MFCVVPEVRVRLLCCASDSVRLLCCASGTCTCFVLCQWYVYVFCVVPVVRVHVLCCASGTYTCFVF